MIKIGLVGDLSFGNAELFAKALDQALATSDYVVQLGDITPAGYPLLKARMQQNSKLHAVRGNHDPLPDFLAATGYLSGAWMIGIGGPNLVAIAGIDNSEDHLGDGDWRMLDALAKSPAPYKFVCAHKSPSPILLPPDGQESVHIMGEGNTPSPDAIKLIAALKAMNAAMCVGHLHSGAWARTAWGDLIVEGRGGSTTPAFFTQLIVQPEGWIAHSVQVQ